MELLWLVRKDVDGDIAVQIQLDGKPQSYWFKQDSRNSSRAGSDYRRTAQEGISMQEAGSLGQASP